MLDACIAERLSAGRWFPPWVRAQHAARAEWCAGQAQGADVVDLGCGGGSALRSMLAAGARRADGVDVSAEALQEARTGLAEFPAERWTLRRADVRQTGLTTGGYDVCLALELIEHLDDPAALVAEARRVLRAGGLFLCSTPHRRLTNPGTSPDDRPYNPFHVREFTRPELQALLQPCFTEIAWQGQSWYAEAYAKRLEWAARWGRREAVRLHQARKSAEALLGLRRDHAVTAWRDDQVPEILVVRCSGEVADGPCREDRTP